MQNFVEYDPNFGSQLDITKFTVAAEPLFQNRPKFYVLKDALLDEMSHSPDPKALYHQLTSLLIILQDKQNGIVTVVDNNADQDVYPTGRCIIRDATNATPFEQRLSPDSPIINSSNLLLRALDTTRAIDYALERTQQSIVSDDQKMALAQNRAALKLRFQALLHAVINLQKELRNLAEGINRNAEREQEINTELQNLEKNLNTDLCLLLDEAGLTPGVKSVQDYADLLIQYRYLAGIIDPTPAVVTKMPVITKQVNGESSKVTMIDTALPITQKTPQQGIALQDALSPLKPERNFFSALKPAIQLAYSAFKSLLLRDDRSLPAQTRKTIAPGVKNGFFVRNQIKFEKGDKTEIVNDWSVRSGSLVYLGKGEEPESVQKHANENIQQVRLNLFNFQKYRYRGLEEFQNIHFTVLNTYSPLEDQHLIVSHTQQAAEAQKAESSYMPTNWDGTNRFNSLAPAVRESAAARDNVATALKARFGEPSILSKPSNRKSRLEQVALVGALVNVGKKFINHFCCASGQDRTGVAIEAATIYKTSALCDTHLQRGSVSKEEIEQARLLSGHQAFMASVLVPGSPGLKKDSKPGSFFDETASKHTFLKSAETNKKVPMSELRLKYFMEKKSLKDYPAMHPDGKALLFKLEEYIDKLERRWRWNPFMKSSSDKREVLLALRDQLVNHLKDGGFDANEVYQLIKNWEGQGFTSGNHRAAARVIIARHRNFFSDQIRPNQDRNRDEQTETQKFIFDLKTSLSRTIDLDAQQESKNAKLMTQSK